MFASAALDCGAGRFRIDFQQPRWPVMALEEVA
jgi:hypothetical protein